MKKLVSCKRYRMGVGDMADKEIAVTHYHELEEEDVERYIKRCQEAYNVPSLNMRVEGFKIYNFEREV